ncbi:hypothetical protein TNCV_1088651 [Trichonephila clavipes]|uniref:Uncharacterized protein n=1 Tax=Trichonephila clavipes TaxID=2585209 RepID=A0A8X6VL61_TRICX|nr:hypothetical protein TNCV_1088651 [Trichonephila clavipes]
MRPCASISSEAKEFIGSGNVSFERRRPVENIFAIRLCDSFTTGDVQLDFVLATLFEVAGYTRNGGGFFKILNNSGNHQTVVVENQHINPPEEPEFMANADSDSPKKPASVFLFQIIA